eukprot:497899_1
MALQQPQSKLCVTTEQPTVHNPVSKQKSKATSCLFIIIIMALAAITIDSLSTNENYKTNDWKSTSKNVVKEAFKTGRIQKPISFNEHFDQLKDDRLGDEKTNPDQILPWAMCGSNSDHILKLSYKINSKSSNWIIYHIHVIKGVFNQKI